MEQQIKRLNGKIIYLHDLLQQHFKKEKIMYAEFNVSPDDVRTHSIWPPHASLLSQHAH